MAQESLRFVNALGQLVCEEDAEEEILHVVLDTSDPRRVKVIDLPIMSSLACTERE